MNITVTYDFAQPQPVALVEADLDYAIDYLRRTTQWVAREIDRKLTG